MEKEFALYPESLELKQLGFDEPCFGYYEPNGDFNYIESNILKNFPYLAKNSEWKDLCASPTYSQAFRWFRKKHGLFVQPNATFDSTGTWYYFSIRTKRNDICEGSFVYEEAELACLRKLIEIVKNK